MANGSSPEYELVTVLPKLQDEVPLDLREVVLYKGPDKPLGFTIRKDGDDIFIGRVVSGSDCEQSGKLRDGDRLVAVNEIQLKGRSLNDATEILRSASGELTFHVQPALENIQSKATSGLVLKALYKYEPEQDNIIPCKELGLPFNRRDIIHVVSQGDGDWWQGYKEGGQTETLARIFPSPRLQKRAGPKKRRTPYYERQSQLQPTPQRRRPLVLVGPPGVGCHELRVRLVESDTSEFAPAVAHIARPAGSDELDGVDFHFVTRGDFQQLKSRGAFIECEKHDGCLYGTSVDSVRAVAATGAVCVLTLNCTRKPEEVAQSLRTLRDASAQLMPFVVFVCPPNADALCDLRLKLDSEGDSSSVLNARQLQGIVEFGRVMRKSLGHLFDEEIFNKDPAETCDQLRALALRLKTESQWVPESWVLSGPADPRRLPDTEFA